MVVKGVVVLVVPHEHVKWVQVCNENFAYFHLLFLSNVHLQYIVIQLCDWFIDWLIGLLGFFS